MNEKPHYQTHRAWQQFVSIMRGTAIAIGWIVILLCFGLASTSAQTPSSQDANSNSKETADKIYHVGGGVTPPRVTHSPDPELSEEARKKGYGGTCVLILVVDTKGLPQDIKVTRAAGMGLDEKAIEAVRKWKFKPAMKDGVPVAVKINIEINFNLGDDTANNYQMLFEKADAGDATAQFKLSQAFHSGNGLPKDESRGFAYLEKAAKQGLPQAQFAMGEYFSSHNDDLVTAYVWYALAQRNRYQHSDKKMKDLAKKMTPEQLAEARQRVESNNPF
jgi:TonB family protein